MGQSDADGPPWSGQYEADGESMPFQIARGNKGRFKSSGLEFEVVDASRQMVTDIRFRWERTVNEIEDTLLVAEAENIPDWGAK
jgi:hypothetical protein